MAGYDWISFTTDYGLSDGFVASCHGMIARTAPQLRVIDVSHQIPPGDVTRGAAVLAQTVPYLPPSVHLAVVDPGVGTVRRAVVLQTPNGLLVGPDNGLLGWAAQALGGIERAVELASTDWFAPTVSRTFHGRDVFAPATARLALGADLGEAGPDLAADSLVRLPDPVIALGDGWLEAEVLTVDRFGNVQLAASGEALAALPDRLTVGGCRAVRGTTFADVPSGGLVVFADSADRIAIAVNGGRAAVMLAVNPGDIVRIS
ncbi:SAM hydrolase/SAM-dependent halogenase family protein [Catellatospora tritici]|uniref:SAM hydrolase/SAM-dependent halogenase family protein n=1 Tax=Catellatospora tritici TaxID=2851566 RepID=UPI001C2D74C8|nr:SAM-dependent chlorinase/fluorinase [Catellatospora tritici]MBV1848556.1 SAM-dependent chlorinase/fluorinase [Catellatospora tritici]MBV1851424.1 SAM-dependent chlorinase/fluorinase [Catellatospora tritici]